MVLLLSNDIRGYKMKLLILLLFPLVLFAQEKNFRHEIYKLPRVENDGPTHMVFSSSVPPHNNGWGHLDRKVYVSCKEREGLSSSISSLFGADEFDCQLPEGVSEDRVKKETIGNETRFYYDDPKNYEIITVDMTPEIELSKRVKQKQAARKNLLKEELSQLDSISNVKLKKVLKLMRYILLEKELNNSELDQE